MMIEHITVCFVKHTVALPQKYKSTWEKCAVLLLLGVVSVA